MPRLDQILANLGYGSRKEVCGWIGSGRVTVGGEPADDPAQKATPGDIRVDGAPLDHPDGILLMLNKPAGLVCSHDTREGANVYGLLPERWRRRNPPVATVGRLDKETTGLLLLTDRSALIHRLTSPKNKVAKVYRATLDREPPQGIEAIFASGQWVLAGESTPCAPAEMRRVGPKEAELSLTEGRYRQVRRMFAGQGCEVTALHRTRFGGLELGSLPLGQWIELSENSLENKLRGP